MPSKKTYKCNACDRGIRSLAFIKYDVCQLCVHSSCAELSDRGLKTIKGRQVESFICVSEYIDLGKKAADNSLNNMIKELKLSVDSTIQEMKLELKQSAVSETWLDCNISDRAVNLPANVFWGSHGLSKSGGVGMFMSWALNFEVAFRITMVEQCEPLFMELYFSQSIIWFEESHSYSLYKHMNILVVGEFNYNLYDIHKSSSMRGLSLRFELSIVHSSKPMRCDVANNSTSLLDYFLVSDISMISLAGQVQCPIISDYALIIVSLKFKRLLKSALVVPIPKSGIVDNVDDFQSISILPAISQIAEYITKDQIFLVTTARIYISQYAFQQG
ncbi:hypothetical protein GQX74_010042 [Glossina fuscipes]|nr:hypothetical protein GQX74_010042 [Glossina fuscipes]